MPIRKEDYPPDWDAISLQVREEAGWQCEWCGAPSNRVVARQSNGAWLLATAAFDPVTGDKENTDGMSWRRLKFFGLTKIILTVAHIDRDTRNNNRDNLAALCQRCHLNHDREAQHIPNRRYGRDHAKEQQGKLEL